MVTVQLTEGEHVIKWTLNGYDVLEARVSVSSTGTVTCLTVTGGSCNSSTPPGVVVSGSTVTGYLKPAATATPTPAPVSDICNWIASKGGPGGLNAPSIAELLDAYIGFRDLGFTPTSQHIAGVLDYRLGFVSSGNQKTGCAY